MEKEFVECPECGARFEVEEMIEQNPFATAIDTLADALETPALSFVEQKQRAIQRQRKERP